MVPTTVRSQDPSLSMAARHQRELGFQLRGKQGQFVLIIERRPERTLSWDNCVRYRLAESWTLGILADDRLPPGAWGLPTSKYVALGQADAKPEEGVYVFKPDRGVEQLWKRTHVADLSATMFEIVVGDKAVSKRLLRPSKTYSAFAAAVASRLLGRGLALFDPYHQGSEPSAAQ